MKTIAMFVSVAFRAPICAAALLDAPTWHLMEAGVPLVRTLALLGGRLGEAPLVKVHYEGARERAR